MVKPSTFKIIIIDKILSAFNISALNEMQLATIEAMKQPGDLILLAPTGSGKTLAYLLPLLDRLQADIAATQALIIVPSRELALQIEQVFKTMSTGYKITCCYGGHLRETEENNLMEAPALIVGTAGRLADNLRRGNIKTGNIQTLILDEFDKSLELGFEEEMKFIVGSLPAVQKRLLTSATDTRDIPLFIGLVEPVKLNFITGEAKEMLDFRVVYSDINDKLETLFRLICHIGDRSAIVFLNHRESVQRTSDYLKEKGIVNVYYHGAMEQVERDSALCKFRNGSSNVLVTTDLASRGLDIPNIRYIIHYHLPTTEEIFTHRNGRTARMDASGTVVMIINPDEKIPEYVKEEAVPLELEEQVELPEKPKWSTLFIPLGKKNKVNKVDIVGFLTNKGQLKKEDVGLIEVKDFISFVAVRRSRVGNTLELIKNEKIKGKKVKIDIAK